MDRAPFTEKVIALVRAIPPGRVCSYGIVARLAGNRRAARQVARILHSCSRTEGLPWHRVINREGRISLAQGRGYEEQRELLESEGVGFDAEGRVDPARFHVPHPAS